MNVKYTCTFDMHNGINQVYLASPLIFSLLIDQLEAFLPCIVMTNLIAKERMSICIAGVLVLMLLFADDIIFMSS